MTTVEVTRQPNRYVTVTQKKNVSVITEPAEQVVEVHDPGVAGAQGIQGIQGPKGEDAKDVFYLHEQNVFSNIWTINHNLGYAPNITVSDSAGTTVEGDIQYVDGVSVTIQFSAPFLGKAYLS